MEIAVTLILGAMTGWLASILVKTDLPMGIVASVALGTVGSFLGVAIARALGLDAQAQPSWIVLVITAILSGLWFVGMLRAAMGLFSRSDAWR
jgi:uncharacterized membrane protein YeaQ/YmgE (transglycosylase-associated protein family)